MVCGVSETAERLLGASESVALQSPASLYFALAQSEHGTFAGRLADAVHAAVDRSLTSALAVQPIVAGSPDGAAVVQMRIGVCGSPRAAVLVLSTVRP